MKEDLTGKTFGRLTAIRPVRKEGNRKKFWLCSCSCGAEKIVEQSHLKSGHTQSCGCYRREAPRKRRRPLRDGAAGNSWFWSRQQRRTALSENGNVFAIAGKG